MQIDAIFGSGMNQWFIRHQILHFRQSTLVHKFWLRCKKPPASMVDHLYFPVDQIGWSTPRISVNFELLSIATKCHEFKFK